MQTLPGQHSLHLRQFHNENNYRQIVKESPMAVRKVVTLLSGGIDSMVLADSLRKQKQVRQSLLFVDYGQRAARREFEAARLFARNRGKLEKVSLHIRGIKMNSQLITGRLRDQPFFPGRNLLLLTIAALKAREMGTSFVAIGLREVPQFPDTSGAFVRAFSGIGYLAFGTSIEVITPLLNRTKAEIVQLAEEYGTPLSISYSCYLGRKRPCCRCLGCKDRKGLIA